MVRPTISIAWGVAFAALGAPLLAGPDLGPGKTFPDLRLQTLREGEIRSVSEVIGRRTLLIVFASW